MTEIGFYHLTRSGIDAALPQLLGRSLAAGQRALILCRTAERVTEIDAMLWACAQPDWLPHGTPKDGDAELQPIWLDTGDSAPNGARFLFVIEGAETDRLAAFDRVFDLFDGKDEAAVAAARVRWSAARAAGFTLTYWQQTERGWERKG